MHHPVYMRFPDLSADLLVFVSDDDLWKVEFNHISHLSQDPNTPWHAIRITTSPGQVLHPKISPDGQHIAYVSNESGERDVYVISRYGGLAKRITYLGQITLIGWTPKGHILASSPSHHYDSSPIYELSLEGNTLSQWCYGKSGYYQKNLHGEILGQHMHDIAHWKGYQGGSVGQIWVKRKGQKSFERLLEDLPHDICNVVCEDQTIYFLCDQDGIGQIFSTDFLGHQPQQITHQKDYYIRSFSVHKHHLLYMSAGDLWLYSPDTQGSHKLSIQVLSSFDQMRPRFIESHDYLQNFACSYDGSWVAVIVRGQLYIMKPWKAGCQRIALSAKMARYRKITSLGNKRDFLAVAVNDQGEDRMVWCQWQEQDRSFTPMTLLNSSKGKIDALQGAGDGSFVVFSTLRQELWIMQVGKGGKKTTTTQRIAHSDLPIAGFDISADGKWVAYSANTRDMDEIFLYHIPSRSSTRLLKSYGHDVCPRFDSKDNLLYFLSTRTFLPVHGDGANELVFFGNCQAFVVSLDKTTPSLFARVKEFPRKDDGDNDDDDTHKDKASPPPPARRTSSSKVHAKGKQTAKKRKRSKSEDESPSLKTVVDFEGMDQRIEPFRLASGGWKNIYVTEHKVFFHRGNVSHTRDNALRSKPYDLSSRMYVYTKASGMLADASEQDEVYMSGNGKYFLCYESDQLKLVPCNEKVMQGDDDDGGPPKGVDLSRIRHRIDPHREWSQMLTEAWYLQKENFNNPERGLNFDAILKRYLSCLSKVRTRSEFSDVLQDMQGDLRTSHCYELYGDYHRRPAYLPTARLGAEFHYLPRKKCYTIQRILISEHSRPRYRSPLLAPGVSLAPGDAIYAIDGIAFEEAVGMERYLENKAGTTIELKVKRQGKKSFEYISVKTLSKHTMVAYEDWVHHKRALVKKLSKDNVGYIHIPDMSFHGISQFYKNFSVERMYKSLIIDIRHNRGGYISCSIISHLMNKSIALQKGKWQKDHGTYPRFSAPTQLVCLIDGYCGSDGDIFSQAFKDLKLGQIVGTRTWGGVIGIWPRIALVDGTLTTQPEFDFVFHNNNIRLENKGTEPHHTVENSPDDWHQGRDQVLAKALQLLLPSSPHPSQGSKTSSSSTTKKKPARKRKTTDQNKSTKT